MIYQAQLDLEAAGVSSWPDLDIFWSPDNVAVSGSLSNGQIGTSFYRNSTIYILGAANADSDEYDDHVLVHEFLHYVTDNISRMTPWVDHILSERLDETVAFSEGTANAIAGILVDDGTYKDSAGVNQARYKLVLIWKVLAGRPMTAPGQRPQSWN